jgi:M6 family metalloprotease-like protein
VAFKDKQFTRTKAQFESLFNQISYTDNGRIPGSLNDYFYLNSYGKFDLQVDVFGPYTLPNPISYYDHNGNGGNGAGARMARAAILAAIADGCSFANYPDPANGAYAIAAHIIFAGYGQEAGAAKNTAIWSHASSFQTITNNAKRMNRYSCTPELRYNSGSQISGIGVIAHELGHSVLGLPDFYDANYDTSGTSVDLDAWCLMATGNWNGRGDIPAFLSAEPRVIVGWAAATELESPQDVTLPDPNAVELGVVYRINTATKNEYFLLENRQRYGWEDGSIPASGMLIYHVDKAGVNWSLAKNEINNNASRRGYYVKQAGCGAPNGCEYDRNNPRSNDVFPRDIFDSFTDVSIPNSKSWAGTNTNKPVTDITRDEYARTVSFKFMGGEGAEPVVSVGNYKKFDGKNGISFEKSVVSDFAKIDVKTPENATVNIVIYDNLGNVVFETSGKSGEIFVWNLTNKTGRYVANGAYLVLAEAKGKTSKKLYLYSAKIGVKR